MNHWKSIKQSVAITILLALLLITIGCENAVPYIRPAATAGEPWPYFQPQQVTLQPSFTRFRSNPDANPSQWLDAYVTVLDNFGDPMKALGHFRFEIFYYRAQEADPRGPRFQQDGLQEFQLLQLEDNQAHWNAITQSYHFQLNLPAPAYDRNDLVIEVTYRPEDNSRLGDFLIVHRGRN